MTKARITTSRGSATFSADELATRLETLGMIVRHGVQYYKNGNPGDLAQSEKFAELLAGDPLADKALAVIREVNEIHRLTKVYKQSAKGLRDHVSTNYKSIAKELASRDGCKCAYCGSTDQLQIDHVKALARGGTNDMSNLQFLCRKCNYKKGAR